jgi:hypothetical protein
MEDWFETKIALPILGQEQMLTLGRSRPALCAKDIADYTLNFGVSSLCSIADVGVARLTIAGKCPFCG